MTRHIVTVKYLMTAKIEVDAEDNAEAKQKAEKVALAWPRVTAATAVASGIMNHKKRIRA